MPIAKCIALPRHENDTEGRGVT